MASMTCIVLMLTAIAQVIGDIHAPHRDIPEAPAQRMGLMFLGVVGCMILSVIVRRELRFRSPGALIETPGLQPVSWPRLLRVLVLSAFSLWLVSTQLPLNLPLLTAFWSAQGLALIVLGVAELMRDSILDRQHWVMNTIVGVKRIGEGLVLVLMCRTQDIDSGILEALLIFCIIVGGLVFIPSTLSMVRGRRGAKPSGFSPMHTVDEASEELMQLVVDRYDSGATLETQERWKRRIRAGLIAVITIMAVYVVVSVLT
jgi:hypothetical protein